MTKMNLAEESSAPEKDKVPVANCLLLASSSSSSSFAQYSVPLLLFSKTPPSTKLNLQSQVSEAAARLLRHLHHSIVSPAADTCLRFVCSPLLNNFFSSPTHFCNFSKINQGDCRNTDALRNHNFAAVLPGDSVAGVVVGNGILNFLNIYNTLLIVRLVLTWFPNSPSAIVSPLSTLCDPYLNIFRGIIPPLGGTLDLSPILAFLVLNAFTSAAAALPAELPPTGRSPGHFVPPISSSHLTTSQHKWARRLFGSKIKNSNDDN